MEEVGVGERAVEGQGRGESKKKWRINRKSNVGK